MRSSFILSSESRGVLVVGPNTTERLSGTCFRGGRQAGDFLHWRSPDDVFADEYVRREFLADVGEVIGQRGQDRARRSQSLTIVCPGQIGWRGTHPSSLYSAQQLEQFQPNRRSTAWRIKPGVALAPLTHDLTIIYDLLWNDDDEWAVIVGSMYPGPDIGVLRGNITENEGIVFFAWDNPGE
ncbi:TPA: hypothetical protein DEP96_01390 [Candidatus Uhrbacteria bacterium]|nr:hypothetical protein [Candidatus Uhrbacteria bacterium]